MRTTISIEDGLLRRAKLYAESRSLGLGRALEELIARGLEPEPPLPHTKSRSGLIPFTLPPGSPTVTSERVKELENDAD